MSFRIRPVRPDDFPAIYEMAKLTGGGFTNLPPDRGTLVAKLARSDDVKQQRPAPFRELLGHGEAEAQLLQDALAAWSKRADNAARPPAAIDLALKNVTSSCAACHKAYRD